MHEWLRCISPCKSTRQEGPRALDRSPESWHTSRWLLACSYGDMIWFKDISIFSSGSHVVQPSWTFWSILVQGNMRTISVKWERSGSVVECLTRDRGERVWASPASLRCGPWTRHIYPSLVLIQPRKTRPCLTERLLMGLKESNQTKKRKFLWNCFYFGPVVQEMSFEDISYQELCQPLFRLSKTICAILVEDIMWNYFKFGPAVQEKMSLKDITHLELRQSLY